MLISDLQMRQLKENLSREPWKGFAEKQQAYCDKLLDSPFPETSVAEHNWTLLRARKLLYMTVSLTVQYRLTGNEKYAKKAIAFLTESVDWELWFYKTAIADQGPFDLGTGETALTFAIALPWLREVISETEHRFFLEAMNRRILTAYLDNTEPGGTHLWWYHCLNNWNCVCNGGALAIASYMASCGYETERALLAQERALAALDIYFDGMHPDGSCDEGTGYWSYATKYFTLCLLYWENVHNKKHPFFDTEKCRNWLSFPLHMTPGNVAMSFGDVNSFGVSGSHIALAVRAGDQDVLAELIQRGIGQRGEALWPLLFYREPQIPAKEKPASRVVWYPDNGWGILTNGEAALSFRSGSSDVNHAQKDLNAIQLSKNGVMLLSNLANNSYSVGWFGEARHLYFEDNTTSKNAQLLNGIGQIRYAEAKCSFDGSAITSDCSPAFPDFAEKVERRVSLDDNGFILRDAFAVKQEMIHEIRFLTYGTFTQQSDSSWRVDRDGVSALLVVSCDMPFESRIADAVLSTDLNKKAYMLRICTKDAIYHSDWQTTIHTR